MKEHLHRWRRKARGRQSQGNERLLKNAKQGAGPALSLLDRYALMVLIDRFGVEGFFERFPIDGVTLGRVLIGFGCGKMTIRRVREFLSVHGGARLRASAPRRPLGTPPPPLAAVADRIVDPADQALALRSRDLARARGTFHGAIAAAPGDALECTARVEDMASAQERFEKAIAPRRPPA